VPVTPVMTPERPEVAVEVVLLRPEERVETPRFVVLVMAEVALLMVEGGLTGVFWVGGGMVVVGVSFAGVRLCTGVVAVVEGGLLAEMEVLESVEDTGLVTGVLAVGVAFFTGAVATLAGVLAEVVTGVVFVIAGGTAFLVPIGVLTGFATGVVLEAGFPSLAGADFAGVVFAGVGVLVEAIGSGFLVPIGVLTFAGVDADFVAVETCVGVFFALSATFATPS